MQPQHHHVIFLMRRTAHISLWSVLIIRNCESIADHAMYRMSISHYICSPTQWWIATRPTVWPQWDSKHSSISAVKAIVIRSCRLCHFSTLSHAFSFLVYPKKKYIVGAQQLEWNRKWTKSGRSMEPTKVQYYERSNVLSLSTYRYLLLRSSLTFDKPESGRRNVVQQWKKSKRTWKETNKQNKRNEKIWIKIFYKITISGFFVLFIVVVIVLVCKVKWNNEK